MLYVLAYVGLYELSQQIYLGAKHLDKYGISFIYSGTCIRRSLLGPDQLAVLQRRPAYTIQLYRNQL